MIGLLLQTSLHMKGGDITKKDKNTLGAKEELFCLYSAVGYSPTEAAVRSGFQRPSKNGVKLLARKDILKRIGELLKTYEASASAESGLRRIAFGGIGDVLRLISTENIQELDPDALDLFPISELKFSKSGWEIKLFDRIKALDKLAELNSARRDANETDFFDVLNKSAAAISGEKL